MNPIKILVVDDHPVVRAGLTGILSLREEFTVVGEAENGLEAIERAHHLHPDVILMDLRMPQLDGVQATIRILSEDSYIKVIALTTYDSDEYVFQAIDAGAAGYLLKDSSWDELFQAVRAAYHGGSPLDPGVTGRLLNRLARRPRHTADTNRLSQRELEVLREMAQGATNKEIATSLSISRSTVKTHVFKIFQKLGVNARTEAVTKAMQEGIIRL